MLKWGMEGDKMRIGQSIDIHQLVENRKLILGGVEIPYVKGLKGHSDADVLLHAVIESIIGAMGLGDIGKHFPDTDPKYKGISSMILLEHTYQMMIENGYKIGNIDSIIMCEQPKMAPHILKMRENISKVLHCDINQVNVKATRGEKLGFVGRKEGIVSQCVVLLEEIK
jgi:2-C-methyl-D-erythritol 2,4-cyclodiphosphate synthase